MMPELSFAPISGALPVRRACITASGWRDAIAALHAADARLLALWADDARDRGAGFGIHAVLQEAGTLTLLDLALDPLEPVYPAIDALYPFAERMQRAAFDLLGVRAEPRGTGAARPWLRHDAWRESEYPLRSDFRPGAPGAATQYGFVKVQGEGVHEIPVGPVHAGIIEPGHFRFSVVGEKVLRLEQRLGYTHKGIERRFTELAPPEARKLAARVSGDSAVAYSWAWCMAYESIHAIVVPARGLLLRALLLERERIANHLGDLGALGNDAGFAVGLAQFLRLKEDLLRANATVFGARYPMDAIVIGGVACDIDDGGMAAVSAGCDALEREIAAMRAIYENHAGMRDRFAECGRVTAELAKQLGLCGLAGRASGQWHDLRCDLPCAPWEALEPRKASQVDGDVLARVALRFDELAESLRLERAILGQLRPGPVCAAPWNPVAGGLGLGAVEGWRGPVLIALELGADGTIRRCHAHDPSWQNWPVLEHAVIGNIVPDFPLINKSFNLSYSGHDL
jgi:Ni,Fe-hydrogenase III large subunit/Ni,Fe-hydrogenase III component G